MACSLPWRNAEPIWLKRSHAQRRSENHFIGSFSTMDPLLRPDRACSVVDLVVDSVWSLWYLSSFCAAPEAFWRRPIPYKAWAGPAWSQFPSFRTSRVTLRQTCARIPVRAGRGRKLTMSSCLKFKIAWHQFSTAQFPRHQFVWKVRSVQFGARGPRASD